MIRLRFPRGHRPPEHLRDARPGVTVTDDAGVVAAEDEKNSAAQFADVERFLRPVFVERWGAAPQPFSLVSVETRAGCNYECSFCPVARSVDPRPAGELSLATLRKVAVELAELGFSGRVSLFGNNEPLLDPRLTEIIRLFRTRCPDADLRVLTNGTRATPQLVLGLFAAGLSTLIINNYTDGQRLIAPVRTLIGAAESLLPHDVRVSVRNRRQVLTTRAGLSPNKPTTATAPRGFCALPFTDLHITYLGDVNLCCVDAYGRVPMGNVAESSIADIWRSAKFGGYRRALLSSDRSALTPCNTCDFDGFRDPHVRPGRPLTRSDLEDEWSSRLEQG